LRQASSQYPRIKDSRPHMTTLILTGIVISAMVVADDLLRERRSRARDVKMLGRALDDCSQALAEHGLVEEQSARLG
jgi:hypothetical protein